jgi:hypothetical protein
MATRLRGRPTGVSEQPDEQQPPRLQDTSERDALSLPLPGGEGEGDTSQWVPPGESAEAVAEEPAPVEAPAPVEEPTPEPEPVTEPEPPTPPPAPVPDPEPDPEPAPDPEPVPEPPPAATGNGAGGHDTGLPPFEPAPSVAGIGASSEGPPVELLVGAAFLGGIALAFFIKRLGS